MHMLTPPTIEIVGFPGLRLVILSLAQSCETHTIRIVR